MRKADVIPAQPGTPAADAAAVSLRLGQSLLGRASSAALSIFLRPWVALVLVTLVVVVPGFLITDIVFDDTNTRLEGSRRAEQVRASETGAKIVADRVGGLQTDLVALA